MPPLFAPQPPLFTYVCGCVAVWLCGSPPPPQSELASPNPNLQRCRNANGSWVYDVLRILAGVSPAENWLDPVLREVYDVTTRSVPPSGTSLISQIVQRFAVNPSQSVVTPTLIADIARLIPAGHTLFHVSLQLALLHMINDPDVGQVVQTKITDTFKKLVETLNGAGSEYKLVESLSLLSPYTTRHCGVPSAALLGAFGDYDFTKCDTDSLLHFLDLLLREHPSLKDKTLGWLATHIVHLNKLQGEPTPLIHSLAVYSLLTPTYSRVVDGILLSCLGGLLKSFPEPEEKVVKDFMDFTALLGLTLDSLQYRTFGGDSVVNKIFSRGSYLLLTAVHHIMVLMAQNTDKKAALAECKVVLREHCNLPVEGLLAKVLQMEGGGGVVGEEERDVVKFVAEKRIVEGEKVGAEWFGQ